MRWLLWRAMLCTVLHAVAGAASLWERLSGACTAMCLHVAQLGHDCCSRAAEMMAAAIPTAPTHDAPQKFAYLWSPLPPDHHNITNLCHSFPLNPPPRSLCTFPQGAMNDPVYHPKFLMQVQHARALVLELQSSGHAGEFKEPEPGIKAAWGLEACGRAAAPEGQTGGAMDWQGGRAAWGRAAAPEGPLGTGRPLERQGDEQQRCRSGAPDAAAAAAGVAAAARLPTLERGDSVMSAADLELAALHGNGEACGKRGDSGADDGRGGAHGREDGSCSDGGSSGGDGGARISSDGLVGRLRGAAVAAAAVDHPSFSSCGPAASSCGSWSVGRMAVSSCSMFHPAGIISEADYGSGSMGSCQEAAGGNRSCQEAAGSRRSCQEATVAAGSRGSCQDATAVAAATEGAFMAAGLRHRALSGAGLSAAATGVQAGSAAQAASSGSGSAASGAGRQSPFLLYNLMALDSNV